MPVGEAMTGELLADHLPRQPYFMERAVNDAPALPKLHSASPTVRVCRSCCAGRTAGVRQ